MANKIIKTKKETTIDDLAIMVQKGFVDMKDYVDRGFKRVNDNFKQVDDNFKRVDDNFKQVDNNFKQVRGDMENLRLEVTQRRVHIFDHKDLEFRVERLEEKVGTGRGKIK